MRHLAPENTRWQPFLDIQLQAPDLPKVPLDLVSSFSFPFSTCHLYTHFPVHEHKHIIDFIIVIFIITFTINIITTTIAAAAGTITFVIVIHIIVAGIVVHLLLLP